MLLVVWHPVPPSIHQLRDSVLAGFADAGDALPVRSLAAPDAGPEDVDAAKGLVLVTTENFGMVSGLVKDFLERIYPWFEEVPSPAVPVSVMLEPLALGFSDSMVPLITAMPILLVPVAAPPALAVSWMAPVPVAVERIAPPVVTSTP